MDDLPDLVRHADNFNVARQLRDHFPHPYTAENGRGFIQRQLDEEIPTAMAIALGGRAIGGIGIHPCKDIHRMNAEIGYWLGEPFWGKGILSTVIPSMVDYAFEHFPIDRIFATVSHRNAGSRRVLEKSGFVLEARFRNTLIKLDERHDELIFAIRREQL
jgi:RimJ/RimL family protein N-acetyltransferase